MKITTYNDHRSAPFSEPWSSNSYQVYSGIGADAVIQSADPGPTNGVTTFQYDALSRTTRVIPSDGNGTTGANSVSSSYTGNCSTTTDQAGKARKSCSDALGRLTQVTENPGGLGYVTTYGYDALDNLTGVLQNGSRQRTFTYNSLSQLLTASNPESGTITYSYDNAGNTSSKLDARSISTYFSYDSLNRLTAKSYSDHTVPALYLFDGQTPPATTPTPGTATVIIGGSEQSKYVCPPGCRAKSCCTLVYDNGIISVWVNGHTENVYYGPSSTNTNFASALASAFNSDSSSPVTASVSGSIVTLTAKVTGPASNYLLSVTSSYDTVDFTHASFFASGSGFSLTGGCYTDGSITMTNGIGRRTGMCDAAGAEAWTYDPVGRTAADRRNTNGATKTGTYAYNLDGSLATLTYPSGRMINYSYDPAARAISAVDPTGPINYALNATYAPQGGLASLQNGGSLYSTFLYNDRLQPCWMYSTNTSTGAPTGCTQTGVTNGAILDYQYSFNLGVADNGNVSQIANRRDPTRTQSFTYDNLNRIATAQTQTTGVTIPNSNCWGLTFGYDPWGNQLSSSATGPAGCSEPLPTNFSVSLSNRLLTDTVAGQVINYCYDAAGNLMHSVVAPASCPASGPYQYTYNAENQLTATAGVTYTYDGDGKRVQKSNGKLYWYGAGSDPLDETDLAGNTNNTSFFEYAFFGGKRIARRDSSNTVDYYFADHLGTARIVTDAIGTMPPLDDSDFYPFGGERPILSSSGNNYKFTGKERDSESGLDNFRARFFGSSMGRFTRPDPITLSKRKLVDPQQWNLYSYSRNNPLRFMDPTGMYTVDCGSNVNNCDKQIQKLDKAINNALKSKNKDVVEAAEAYGKLNDKNGVNVAIVNVVDAQHPNVNGTTTSQAATNGMTFDESTGKVVQATQVTIKAGMGSTELEETAVHEGVHVEDRAAVINTVTPDFHYNNFLNWSGRQSEVNAYHVENEWLSEHHMPERNIHDILSNPPYSDSPSMDRLLFPALGAPGFPQ